MKFRLLFGRHVDTDPRTLHLPAERQTDVQYVAPCIVESDLDLCQFNGRAGDARKFERLMDEGVAIPATSPLTWDPSRESLDQFTDRVSALTGKPLTTATQPSPMETATLRAMTAQELAKYAEEEEIDLKGAKDKDAMVRIIAEAKGFSPPPAGKPQPVVAKK